MRKRVPVLKIIIPIISIAASAYFVPWLILRAWIAPTPDTIQEQVEMGVAVRMACMDLLARNLRAERGRRAVEVMA